MTPDVQAAAERDPLFEQLLQALAERNAAIAECHERILIVETEFTQKAAALLKQQSERHKQQEQP